MTERTGHPSFTPSRSGVEPALGPLFTGAQGPARWQRPELHLLEPQGVRLVWVWVWVVDAATQAVRARALVSVVLLVGVVGPGRNCWGGRTCSRSHPPATSRVLMCLSDDCKPLYSLIGFCCLAQQLASWRW